MERIGKNGRKSAGRPDHDTWLRAQTWSLPALDQTHRAYQRAVEEGLARLHDVESDLRALLDLEPLRPRIARLRCFRGIDDLTALTIAAELGDARRFARAPSLMAYVGLVPSEHSSGSKRVQGGITKTGNAHLRRVLVESAWHYRHHPFVSAALRTRQRGAPAAVVAQACRVPRSPPGYAPPNGHLNAGRERRRTGRGRGSLSTYPEPGQAPRSGPLWHRIRTRT